MILLGSDHDPYFRNENTEAQRGEVTCQGMHSYSVEESWFELPLRAYCDLSSGSGSSCE